jgi:hypothetical protein
VTGRLKWRRDREISAAMRKLSAAVQQAVNEAAARHGFRPTAVAGLLANVIAGHGRMAQFDDPEFGGHGQWMRGGMTMIGDMFNSALKARVEQLCDELADIAATMSEAGDGRLFVDSPASADHWWPSDFGRPDSAGGQNDLRYAYFMGPRRLAIDCAGTVTVYDTLDHRIEGVAQQQGRNRSTTFYTQHGTVDLASLRIARDESTPQPASHEPASRLDPDIFEAIAKLVQLHARGILSESEFANKKAEFLSRL